MSRLIDALCAANSEITSEELTDAVWLLGAVYRRSGTAAADRPEPTGAAAEPPATPSTPDGPVAEEPAGGAGADVAAAGRPPAGPGADWYLPSQDRLLESASLVSARSPAAAALPGTLALGRSLRPLRRRLPSRTTTHLDVEATVSQAADGELVIPEFRPALDRWLNLALVIEDSTSMAVWRQTTVELRDLLVRTGAFRDVRVWRYDGDLAAPGRLRLRPEGSAGATTGRDARELVDPTGRTAVLVVSDCVGRAWSAGGTGGIGGALRVWGTAGPVAIVQPLPERLWAGCAPPSRPVRFGTQRPGAPNAELTVRTEDGSPVPAGVPVPLLELDTQWLATWSALVAADGSGWVPGTAIFTEWSAEPAGLLGPRRTGADANEVLDQFFGFASTEACRLASLLTVAPLSLPVMRLVLQSMLPRARPSVLAEVFLGGLLKPRTPMLGRRSSPEEVEYAFVPGVRDRLFAALPRHDALAVLSKVGNFVAARLGSPLDFRAFLAAEPAAAEVLRRDPPFARVALRVLHDLGGRYRDAADRLGRSTSYGDTAAVMADPRIAHDTAAARLPHASETTGNDDLIGPPEPDLGGHVVTSPPATVAVPAEPATTVSAQPTVFGGVPYRNPHFTGRQPMLERLRATLHQGTTQMALLPHALHGLGGVGKTQLAVEYAYRYAADYDLVWWVPAESVTTVRLSLVELAAKMGVPSSADVTQTIENVLAALRTGVPFRRWLLVFDNADQPTDLRPYLPVPLGHILITSRNPLWSEVAAQVEVDVFAREESTALLQRRGRGISTAEAAELAEKLGDLPLALDQAAAWQAETGMSVRDFIRLLDERLHVLLDERPPTNYPATVMATWSLGFERLRDESPGAAQLLELCAFFGSEPIAVSLLWEGRNADLPAPLARVLRDDIQLRRAIRDIGRYALAKIDPSRDQIEVHRLVQAVLREQMDPAKHDATRDVVHAILAQANPGDPDNPRTWDRHAALLPHVTLSRVIDAKTDAARRVALDQIRYRYSQGDYERSRHLGEAAVRRWRETLGYDHELTLVAQRHLGNALRALGDRDRARRLNQETLDALRERFGDEHEHTLATANSVGADLRGAGDFRGARALDEQNLERYRRIFTIDDPATLRSMNNLALDVRLLGNAVEALKLDRETHRRYDALLGPDRPLTLQSLTSVGRDLYDAGQYRDALAVLTGAMPRFAASLSADDAWTLLAKRITAMVLRRLGRSAEALGLAEEVDGTVRSRYRADHETRLATMITLANARLATGDPSGARASADEALRNYRDSFGPDHPFTLAAAVDLAVVLRALGDQAAARDLDENALRSLRRVLGDDHPYTLAAMLNTANDLVAGSDHPRARELTGEALARSRAVRGEDHPETLACALNHSLDLRATGARDEADELQAETLLRYRAVLGDDHPDTRAAAEGGSRANADIEIPST